jgi:hypothetical protein
VNILGTVSGACAPVALTWQLNGAQPAPLSVGPDGLRLRKQGDFNAEVPVRALREGPNDLRLEAHDALGRQASRDVIIHYVPNKQWRLPYTVDFRDAASVTEAVQVIDGRWKLTPEGIRPEQPAYDRLLTLGDVTWRDYRVTVVAQVHGFVEEKPTPQRADTGLMGGFGLLFRWTGHHVDEHQPHREWRPNGAIGWYRARWEDNPARYRCLNISDAVVKDELLTETPPVALDTSRPYAFDFAVRSQVHAPSHYRYRVWPVDQPDDLLCDLTAAARPGEATRGSVLFIALYADVTIVRLHAAPA